VEVQTVKPDGLHSKVLDHIKEKYPDSFKGLVDPQGHKVVSVKDIRDQVYYDGLVISDIGIYGVIRQPIESGSTISLIENLVESKGLEVLDDAVHHDVAGIAGLEVANGKTVRVKSLDPRADETRGSLKDILTHAQQEGDKAKNGNSVTIDAILADL